MNTTKHAVIDSLSKPAIDNGRTYPRIPDAKRPTIGKFGPVVVKQQGIGSWRCDACRTRGSGLQHLKRHHERTGHAMYTDTNWEGIE